MGHVWAEKFPLTRFHNHPELHDPSVPSSTLDSSIQQAELQQNLETRNRQEGTQSRGAELSRPSSDKISMMEIGAHHRMGGRIRAMEDGEPTSYYYDAANPPAYITPPWAAPSRQTGPIIPTIGAYPDAKMFNANAVDNKLQKFVPPQPIFPMDQGLEESDTREGSNNFDYSSLTPTVYPRDMTDDNIHGVYGVPIYLEKQGKLHSKRKHKHHQQHQQQHQHQHHHRLQQQEQQHEDRHHSSSTRHRHEHHHRLYTREEDRRRAHTHGSSYLHSSSRLNHPTSSSPSSPSSYSHRSRSPPPYHSYRTHQERFRGVQ